MRAAGFSVCFGWFLSVEHTPPMSNDMSDDLEPCVAARFTVTADAFPGLLPRLLEPFAKRDLTPDLVRAARQGETMRVEVAMEAMPVGMVHLVTGNLGQVVGVTRVETMEGRIRLVA